MRMIYSGLAAVVIGVVLSNTATAQSPASQVSVPRVIALTGVFLPVDGQPPQAVETVTLAVYAEPTGGTPLWQETQSIALDVKGRYTLLLGATFAEGIPASVLAAGAQWLGTKFDRPGEVESARAQLTSVPYTLRAADADTLGGRPASAYLLAPTAGSAESSAMKPASESRAATSTATTPNAVLPGTDGFVAKYVGTADVGPSAIYEAAGTGNVGIGATNPLDALHVRFTNPGGTATGYAVQNLSGAANAYSGMLFYDQNGVLGQFQGFNNTTHEYRINNVAKNVSSQYNGSINFMTGGTSRFLVTTPGNIGIGTTAPGAILDVSNALVPTSGVANIAATTYNNNYSGTQIIGRKARGTQAAPSNVLNGETIAFFGGKGYGNTGFSTLASGMEVAANENWTDSAQGTMVNFSTTPLGSTQPALRMTIAPNGNVGIGTFQPGGSVVPPANLEVSNSGNGTPWGSILASSFTGTNTAGSLIIGRKARGTSAAPTAVHAGDDLVGFLGQGYGATGFSGTRGGMFVRAAETWTDTAQGTFLTFNTTPNGTTAPTVRMNITASGDVGIGTPAPNGLMELVKTGTVNLFASSYSDQGSGFKGRVARGTPLAPTATQFGDELAEFTAAGYGTTGFNEGAGWAAFAAENWTDTANGTALGFFSTSIGSNQPQLYFGILPDGKIGIGTPQDVNGFPTATDRLQVFGDVRVGDSGTNGCLKRFDGNFLVGTCVSDRRFKKDITPFGRVLDQVSALQPVNYYWRAAEYPERHFGAAQAYGLIAQDVEQVLPELVVTDSDGYKAVDYTKLPLLTIQAVKELKTENDKLETENDQLTRRVAELERMVAELAAAMARR